MKPVRIALAVLALLLTSFEDVSAQEKSLANPTTEAGVPDASQKMGLERPLVPSLELGGFVDAQYKWAKDNTSTSGFLVNDGAVYFKHKRGKAEVLIDLPFSWEKSASTAVDIDGDGQSNDFIVGQNKAQAYIGYQEGATRFQLGQWDSIFGYELNDAPDLFFTGQGLVYNLAMPVTHTGLLVSHALGPVTLKGMAANVSNQGSQSGQKSEFGGQVSFGNEILRAALGYFSYEKVANDPRAVTDLIAGFTLGIFQMDAEVALVREPGQDQSTAFLLMPVLSVSELSSLGLRYEQASKFGTVDTQTQVTGGFQHVLNEALKVKIDYTWGEQKLLSSPKTDYQSAVFSGVYKF